MIRTETNLNECRKLWAYFSPGQDARDDWDLMYAFHDQDWHHLNFLVHHTGDGPADGLLPLVHDTPKDRYMLMAGSYPDGRILWLRNEDFPEFFEHFSKRTVLFDLRQSYVAELDMRYHLVPSEFGFDFHNHIDAFGSEKKQKFLYDLRSIRKREPVLRWSQDNEADFFIELVNRNFGDDSNANELRRVIGELQQSGRLKTLVIEIAGVRQAVSLSLQHGNKMIALYASSNNDFNNLGKLLNVETIHEACRLRVDEISFMTGMKWKADWKMKSEPCHTMRKPPGPWPEAAPVTA